jgi:hypothetical protein
MVEIARPISMNPMCDFRRSEIFRDPSPNPSPNLLTVRIVCNIVRTTQLNRSWISESVKGIPHDEKTIN